MNALYRHSNFDADKAYVIHLNYLGTILPMSQVHAYFNYVPVDLVFVSAGAEDFMCFVYELGA